MANRFVRDSKVRHLFGSEQNRPDQIYSDLKPSVPSTDVNYIKANSQFFAVAWAAAGGHLAVVPHDRTGRLPSNQPLLSGHSAAILDFDFHPFNPYVIATGSEDAQIKIWSIPEGGVTSTITEASATLSSSQKKVHLLGFHPTANNILASASHDKDIRLWDVELQQESRVISGFGDVVSSFSFNWNGSLMATTSKDRRVRVVDPRASAIVAEVEGHGGMKGQRVLWLGRRDKLFTVGFSKDSNRQFSFWDPRQLKNGPYGTVDVDSSSGLFMPFYDEDINVMYLAGKGDAMIRTFEVVDADPYTHFLSVNQFKTPQRGMCALPKYCVNVQDTEVTRFLRLENNAVTPISFRIPRKSEMFQEDLYPETPAPVAAVSAAEWLAGANRDPVLTSLKPGESRIPIVKAESFKVQPKADAPKRPSPSNSPAPLNASPSPSPSPSNNNHSNNAAAEKRIAELESRLNAVTAERDAALATVQELRALVSNLEVTVTETRTSCDVLAASNSDLQAALEAAAAAAAAADVVSSPYISVGSEEVAESESAAPDVAEEVEDQ